MLCPSRVTVHSFWPWPHPAVQIGDFDGVDLAEQISGKAINADAGVLPAFVHHPGVTGMEGIAFGNIESGLLQHDRRIPLLCRSHLQRCRFLWTTEIHDGKNEEERKQDE